MRAPKTGTEVRREQILEAALELIGEEGVYALNISRIAAKVGIVPSALYRHFKSKDEVLNAILQLIKTRILGNITQAGKSSGRSLECLRLLLMRHAGMLSENRAIPCLVFSDGIHTGNRMRQAKVAEIISTHLRKIQEIIDGGIRDGSIREDVDPQAASIMFLGMLLPAAVLHNISEGGFDIVGHAEKAWPAFAKGIAADR